MKKLLTLTLSLLMVFSMCLTVSADEKQKVTIKVNDSSELVKAFYQANTNFSTTTIELQAEIEDTTGYFVNSDGDVILNLNGNKLYTPGFQCEGSLTIIDGNQNSDSGIQLTKLATSTNNSDHIKVYEGGTFTLNSGKIKLFSEDQHSDRYIIAAGSKTTVNINGGAIEGKETPVGKTADNNGATINITGGTFDKDVSAYLGEGCSIIYSTTYRNYVVYNQDTKPTVDEDAGVVAAINATAGKTLNGMTTIKEVNKNGSIPNKEVDSTTKYKLTSTFDGELTGDYAKEMGKLLKEKISNLDTTDLAYFSLEVELDAEIVTDGVIETYSVRDLGTEDFPITLYLSDEIVEKLTGKEIKVIREHTTSETEEWTAIEDVALDVESKTLTFKSGKFSSYYIAYKTSSGSSSDSGSGSSSSTATTTTPTKTYDPKDKNKDGVVSCEEEMNSANWVWSTTKGACVYSVTNTSTK